MRAHDPCSVARPHHRPTRAHGDDAAARQHGAGLGGARLQLRGALIDASRATVKRRSSCLSQRRATAHRATRFVGAVPATIYLLGQSIRCLVQRLALTCCAWRTHCRKRGSTQCNRQQEESEIRRAQSPGHRRAGRSAAPRGCAAIDLAREQDATRGGGDVPAQCRMEEADRFLQALTSTGCASGWAACPSRCRFVDGAMMPVRGAMHRIRFIGPRTGARGAASRTGSGKTPRLEVAGRAEHAARRLSDWLVGEARADLEARVSRHARKLGVRARRIVLRDPDHALGLVLGQRPAVVLLAPDPGAGATCSTTSPPTRWRICAR